MNQRLLLTGATGFIGNAILRAALLRGHKILALVRDSGRLFHSDTTSEQLKVTVGTLATANWAEIKNFAPTVCVHSAWIATPGIYLESSENVQFLKWSQEFMRRAHDAGVQQTVVLGSCIEYDINGDRLDEIKSTIAPKTLYGKCKAELHGFLIQEGFKHCWARVFYPYGPREHSARLCTSIINDLLRGRDVVLKTPESTKDYIYVSDVASAVMKIVERSFEGAINIGTGEETTVRRIATVAASMLDSGSLLKFQEPSAFDPFPYVVANSDRLRGIGWVPDVSLAQGLQTLISSLRQSGD
jgi:nucleoside-diphosphate-sugar epimerase